MLPDLSIRQLEYLVAVADEPTWAAAAERVGVSPSALSQGLGELERRLGVGLFSRDGRRRVLRPSAQPALEHARRVLALTGDLARWSRRTATGQAGELRIGMIDVAAVTHYSNFVRSFRAARPSLEFSLTVAPSAQLLANLREGRHDVVVCVEPSVHPSDVVVIPVRDEELRLVAPKSSSAVPSWSVDRWGPWVLFPRGSHTRAQVLAELRNRGASDRIVAESHQPEVLLEMVAMGLGWSVLPQAHASTDRADIAWGPTLGTRRLVLAHRRASSLDPVAADFARDLVAIGGEQSGEQSA